MYIAEERAFAWREKQNEGELQKEKILQYCQIPHPSAHLSDVADLAFIKNHAHRQKIPCGKDQYGGVEAAVYSAQ